MGVSTGHGTTFNWGQQGALSLIRSASGYDYSGPAADKSHLQTNIWREYLPPDLYELRPFTVTGLLDSEAVESAAPNTPDTLTITLPLAEGEQTAATIVGLACYTRVQVMGPIASNQENLRELEIQWLNHPTFTPAVPAP